MPHLQTPFTKESLATNIPKVWEDSKPGSAEVKKDSTHIFGL